MLRRVWKRESSLRVAISGIGGCLVVVPRIGVLRRNWAVGTWLAILYLPESKVDNLALCEIGRKVMGVDQLEESQGDMGKKDADK